MQDSTKNAFAAHNDWLFPIFCVLCTTLSTLYTYVVSEKLEFSKKNIIKTRKTPLHFKKISETVEKTKKMRQTCQYDVLNRTRYKFEAQWLAKQTLFASKQRTLTSAKHDPTFSSKYFGNAYCLVCFSILLSSKVQNRN